MDKKIQQVLDEKFNVAAFKKNIKVRCVRTKKEGVQVEVFLKIECALSLSQIFRLQLKMMLELFLREELCYPSLNVRLVGDNLE